MKSLMLVLAGSLAVAPLAVAQDHAVPRGGGGGGGGGGTSGGHPGVSSSSGGSSSGGGYSGGGYSGGSSSSSSSGGSSSVAERRHPRAGTGRGGGGGAYGGGAYYPGYWGGYYPSGWYGSYWWPYGAYGWYGGYWGGYPGWGWGPGGGSVYHYVQRETGSVRVLVDPPEARVYVDGYYAGTVDDYDGLFQRLNISPGRHEISLKLEGYKTHRMRVYVSPERTLKLRYDMQKGSGDTFEDLAGNVPERELRRERDRERDEDRWNDAERRDRSDDRAADGGRLKLTVRPPDASVYVDGAFRGSGREASTLLLAPGRHRIEVVRPGFRTIERDVEITAGDTADLTVELDKGSI